MRRTHRAARRWRWPSRPGATRSGRGGGRRARSKPCSRPAPRWTACRFLPGTRRWTCCCGGAPAKASLSCRARSVARHRWIDEDRPGVDPALQVVEVPESLAAEVLGRLLAAYAVVALEHDRRLAIAQQQRIVVRLVEQAKAVDGRNRALFRRANVDQLDRGAALDHRFHVRRRDLVNRPAGARSVV